MKYLKGDRLVNRKTGGLIVIVEVSEIVGVYNWSSVRRDGVVVSGVFSGAYLCRKWIKFSDDRTQDFLNDEVTAYDLCFSRNIEFMESLKANSRELSVMVKVNDRLLYDLDCLKEELSSYEMKHSLTTG